MYLEPPEYNMEVLTGHCDYLRLMFDTLLRALSCEHGIWKDRFHSRLSVTVSHCFPG